jgi:glycogen debranching enzyme
MAQRIPSSAGGSPSDSAARLQATAGAGDRPTPANPVPGAEEVAGVPTPIRVLPPELGSDAIAVLEGRAFFYSDSRGDVPRGSIGGFVRNDTRFIGTWVLTLNGEPLSVLRSGPVDYYSAAFFLTNPELPDLPKNTLSIRRTRFVGQGVHEEISVHSFADHPVRFELRLSLGADFADLFEIKAEVRDRSEQTRTESDAAAGRVSFVYEHETFTASTHVTGTGVSRIDGADLVWDVGLEPRGEWETAVEVEAEHPWRVQERRHESFGELRKRADDALSRWQDQVPEFESDWDLLEAVFRQSVTDLAALRITGRVPGLRTEVALPAAGLPWFMTLFGRDTLLTAAFSIWVGPELAEGGLVTLALVQGKEVNDFRDEEPGKIAHEVRTGELTLLGLKPHNPYYGNTDATQLWLSLLWEYWTWTGDQDFVRSMEPNIVAALEWIDRHGDPDGDGYIEYATRSPQGLGNQCWKDSYDGIQFADGRIPYLPIAIAEAQGYTYAAKLRIAELIEVVFEDTDWATRVRREAAELRDRFNRDFWVDARGGYYAVGLDGDKQPIDSMTSNMGHLLQSGIVPEDRARVVVDHLMSEAMFSGWGIRTLSTDDSGYNPIGYHLGTIWPHDNAIAARGMARAGFRDEANRICLALLEAAEYSANRLPEAFAGFPRDVGRFPVPYPTACSPQAWATAAPFIFVSVMLGISVQDGRLQIDPAIPAEVGRIRIRGMRAFGKRWDVEAEGTKGEVRESD